MIRWLRRLRRWEQPEVPVARTEQKLGENVYYFTEPGKPLPHVLIGWRPPTREVLDWLRERHGSFRHLPDNPKGTWEYRNCRLPDERTSAPFDAYAFQTADQAFEFRMRWL